MEKEWPGLNHAQLSFVAAKGGRGCLTFGQCAAWRPGPTSDEGWYAGLCRYRTIAPAWSAFYLLTGEDDQKLNAADWPELPAITPEIQHFLFYLRDNTFEYLAAGWRFHRALTGKAIESGSDH